MSSASSASRRSRPAWCRRARPGGRRRPWWGSRRPPSSFAISCRGRCSSDTGPGTRRGSLGASSESFELTPRNATRLPRSATCDWKNGNSNRQGPHHDAHLLTTTGCPRSRRAGARTRPARPSRLVAWSRARGERAARRRAPALEVGRSGWPCPGRRAAAAGAGRARLPERPTIAIIGCVGPKIGDARFDAFQSTGPQNPGPRGTPIRPEAALSPAPAPERPAPECRPDRR